MAGELKHAPVSVPMWRCLPPPGPGARRRPARLPMLLLIAGLLCGTGNAAGAASAGSGPPSGASGIAAADAGASFVPPAAAADNAGAQPGPLAGLAPEVLSLYKTMTYTAAGLGVDQLWYMGVAAQAAATSGYFSLVNLVTAPAVTYAFEYTWQRCCEAPPGPGGVRPIDLRKAVFYRMLSATRMFAITLMLGNGLGSSTLTTALIAVTRTGVYLANDYAWNHLTAPGTAAPAGAVAPPQPSGLRAFLGTLGW